MMDVNNLLQNAFASGQATWYIVLLAFLAGILVSFTPCVYPLIPVTAGLLQSQATRSLVYNFFSSFLYIVGMALVYATFGYLAATSSIIFGKWLANPFFVAAIVIFFLYFACSMFGFYELYTTQFLSKRGGGFGVKGTLINSFLLGVISGTVASPCLTPALATLLGVVAQQANPMLGIITLFCFALGMGILLLLVGTFSATLTLLPRSGEWMNTIKTIFGFLIFATCIYFLQPFFHQLIIGIGYLFIALAAVVFYGQTAKTSKLALFLALGSFLIALALGSHVVKMLL